MRSIKKSFEQVTSKNPSLSSYVCFARAIAGRGFSRDRISRYFHTLVDSEDYVREDKSALLSHLYWLSETSVAYEIHGLNANKEFASKTS